MKKKVLVLSLTSLLSISGALAFGLSAKNIFKGSSAVDAATKNFFLMKL